MIDGGSLVIVRRVGPFSPASSQPELDQLAGRRPATALRSAGMTPTWSWERGSRHGSNDEPAISMMMRSSPRAMPPWGGGAVLEGFEQESEPRLGLLSCRSPELSNGSLLDVGVVDTDRTAAELDAVHDHIVGARAHLRRGRSPTGRGRSASGLVNGWWMAFQPSGCLRVAFDERETCCTQRNAWRSLGIRLVVPGQLQPQSTEELWRRSQPARPPAAPGLPPRDRERSAVASSSAAVRAVLTWNCSSPSRRRSVRTPWAPAPRAISAHAVDHLATGIRRISPHSEPRSRAPRHRLDRSAEAPETTRAQFISVRSTISRPKRRSGRSEP